MLALHPVFHLKTGGYAGLRKVCGHKTRPIMIDDEQKNGVAND